MAITIYLDGSTQEQMYSRIDPLTELGSLLHAVSHGDHHPRARRLREKIQEVHDDELLSSTKRFQPFYGAIRARFLMPLDVLRTPVPDIHQQIDALTEVSVRAFVDMAAVAMTEQQPGAYDFSTLHESQESQRYFMRRIERISMSRVELATDLLEDPHAVRNQLQFFLHRVADEWFQEEWLSGLHLLKADISLREAEIRRYGPKALAGVHQTAVVKPNPLRVVYDKVNRADVRLEHNPIILVPSIHGSPHLIVKFDRGYPLVVQYDVGAVAQESLELIVSRLRVLADPTRIEICRAILRTPRTTVDLAIKLGMSEPQISRHLRALREAGLSTTERQGRLVYYSLNAPVFRSLGTHLLAALQR